MNLTRRKESVISVAALFLWLDAEILTLKFQSNGTIVKLAIEQPLA